MYTIKLNEKLSKRLEKMPRKELERILEKVSLLRNEPRPRWVEKLKGRPAYRLAVGNYRVIYTIEDDPQVVTIVEIDDRKDIYRKY